MNNEERVEAVAKALFGRGELPGSYVPFDVQPLDIKEHYYRLARIAIAAMDIEKIERDAYERGMCDAVELDEWGKSKLFYRKGYGDGAASLQIVTSTTTGRMPKDER